MALAGICWMAHALTFGSVLRLGPEDSESIFSTGVMFSCEKEKYVGYRNFMSWEGDVAGRSVKEQVYKKCFHHLG